MTDNQMENTMNSNISTPRETSVHDRLNEIEKLTSVTISTLERALDALCGQSVPDSPSDVSLNAQERLSWLCERSSRAASLADRVCSLIGQDPRLEGAKDAGMDARTSGIR